MPGARVIESAVLLMLLVVGACGPTFGADPGHDGNERCTWQNKSLIVAKVLDVEKDVRARKIYITLDPKMTVAGTFDSAVNGRIRMPIVLGPFGSPLTQPPPADSLVLIHVELGNEGYIVPGFSARYMPEALPVWEVWGLRDETLLRIVTTVRERRREAADKEAKERANYCQEWLRRVYPDHAKFEPGPIDKSFESRFVVFARIKSVDPPDSAGDVKVALRLIGTVAGRLDAALIGDLTVVIPKKVAAGRELPWRDAEMCVAIDQRDGTYVVAEESLDFMPSGWAFSPNETRPDALVDKILANLRQKIQQDRAGAAEPR